MKQESFVVGKVKEYPEWFKDAMQRGLARKVLDIDGEFMHFKILNAMNKTLAYEGDTIIYNMNGLFVEHKKDKGTKEVKQNEE